MKARCLDVRWQCRQCGRFLPPTAVQSADRIDPGAYYGVSSRTWAECGRCGEVDEPRCTAVGYLDVHLPEETG